MSFNWGQAAAAGAAGAGLIYANHLAKTEEAEQKAKLDEAAELRRDSLAWARMQKEMALRDQYSEDSEGRKINSEYVDDQGNPMTNAQVRDRAEANRVDMQVRADQDDRAFQEAKRQLDASKSPEAQAAAQQTLIDEENKAGGPVQPKLPQADMGLIGSAQAMTPDEQEAQDSWVDDRGKLVRVKDKERKEDAQAKYEERRYEIQAKIQADLEKNRQDLIEKRITKQEADEREAKLRKELKQMDVDARRDIAGKRADSKGEMTDKDVEKLDTTTQGKMEKATTLAGAKEINKQRERNGLDPIPIPDSVLVSSPGYKEARAKAQKEASDKAGFWRSDKTDFPETGGDRSKWIKNRTMELLEQAQTPGLTQSGGGGNKVASVPSKTEWMAAAKKANPKSSQSELEAYFNKKYGM